MNAQQSPLGHVLGEPSVDDAVLDEVLTLTTSEDSVASGLDGLDAVGAWHAQTWMAIH